MNSPGVFRGAKRLKSETGFRLDVGEEYKSSAENFVLRLRLKIQIIERRGKWIPTAFLVVRKLPDKGIRDV